MINYNRGLNLNKFFRGIIRDVIGKDDYLNSVKENVFNILKEKPLIKSDLYLEFEASNYYLNKVLRVLLEENRAFKLTFKQKSNLNLKDHLTYYSTDKKIRL